jgi:hypothetical protein
VAPASPAQDVFLAGPKTYTPNRDRQGRDISPYLIPGVAGGGYPFVASGPGELTVNVRILPPEAPATVAAAPAPVPPALPPPNAPGPPKTFYVIPGCYAGDKHPRDTTFAARCDAARVRVVRPVVSVVR